MENLRKKKIAKLKPEVWLSKAVLPEPKDKRDRRYHNLIKIENGIGYATTGKIAFISAISEDKNGYRTKNWEGPSKDYFTKKPQYPFPNFGTIENMGYNEEINIVAYREVSFSLLPKSRKYIEIEAIDKFTSAKIIRYAPAKNMLNLLKGFNKSELNNVKAHSVMRSDEASIPVRYKSAERTAYIMFSNLDKIIHLNGKMPTGVKEYICELIIK
jgi:hypothetical protein